MEVIANWMHCQSIGTDKTQRSIAKYADLKEYLTKHIENVEKLHDPDKEPEDLADEFLDFVKTKVGLLIEVGDAQYSFIHLTFQEYLTSSNIITSNEKTGVSGIWETIKDYCDSPSWHEVIRLMLGSLKSNDSQEEIIENIIAQETGYNRALLLGGLLLDGIESAEYHQEEILKRLLIIACKTDDLVQLRPLIAILREWIAKDCAHKQSVALAFKSLWDEIEDSSEKIALLLIMYALNWSEEEVKTLIGTPFPNARENSNLFRIFIRGNISGAIPKYLTSKIETFWQAKDYLLIDSPYGNLVAFAGQSVSATLEYYTFMKRSFEELMVVIGPGLEYGAFRDFILNNILISPEGKLFINALGDWSLPLQKRQEKLVRREPLRIVLEQLSDSEQDRRILIGKRSAAKLFKFSINNFLTDEKRAKDSTLEKIRDGFKVNSPDKHSKNFLGSFWEEFLATSTLYTPLLDLLCDVFVEELRAQWWEALRVKFLPKVPERINLVNQSEWKRVEQAFEEGRASNIEIYSAAWQLLFDVWLYIFKYSETPDKTLFHRIAELTRNSEAASLRIAHCIRDIAYGDESRAEDLLAMLRSDAPEYRSIFETCGWIKPHQTSGAKAKEGQAVENSKKIRKTSKT